MSRLVFVSLIAAIEFQSPLPRPAPEPPPHAATGAFNRALGVECLYCHNPESTVAAPKPPYAFAQRMMRMVEGLNAGILKDLGPISCWTCHRGQSKPARLPRDRWEAVRAAHADVFVGPRERRALAMSVYAASLGVKCKHCHVVGDWASDTKSQKTTALRMLEIFDEIPKYFEGERQPSTQCFMCHQGEVKPER